MTQDLVGLIQALVQAPSRGGIDPYGPVVDVLTGWQRAAGLTPRVLSDGTGPVAVVADVVGERPGRHLVLDACLDTADIGDPGAWSRDPFCGEIADGWLHGRGAADSKAAVAIFSALAAALDPGQLAGRVTVLADLDEHTGGFAGIRTYLQDAHPDAVVIGYPGLDKLVVGGRGVYRARVAVYGIAEHSGSSRPARSNAVVKAARLVDVLALDAPTDQGDGEEEFPLPPKVTVTSIAGGTSGVYSVIPDLAVVEVDIRLTPTYPVAAARQLLEQAVAYVDEEAPSARPSTVEQVGETWPPFRLPAGHWLADGIVAGARTVGLAPVPTVAGPSNIGCFLAGLGIPATAGFGVGHVGLHGTDEAIELSTVPAVLDAHRAALRVLLPTMADLGTRPL